QKSIDKLIETTLALDFNQLNAKAGTHLEAYNGARDPRARTMRVDKNHRLIAMDLGDGASLLFVRVDTHHKVDQWMARNEFRINQATSAIEIVDVETVREAAAIAEPAAPAGLLAHRKAKDLSQLGIETELIGVLLGISTEDALLAIAAHLPPGQADALLMLSDKTRSVESIYEAIAGSITPDEVDTSDFVAALDKPANRASYHLVTGDEELARMLAAPSAVWRTYLHHSQRSLAYRPTYNGPARVTGGAGTGKTVVAIHRALALAQPYLDRGDVPPTKPILFTTFTRNLAQAIERDLRLLGGSDLLDLVDVVNVDQLARRIVNDADPNAPAPRMAD
ncbi:MAG: DNA helicase, partial [Actinomycetia bacterium]|nr:DNA helicase [Actinomycetes bacterium]